MHAYDKCGLVWEREIGPDHIQWGWCTKPRGHSGPHGHASETPADVEIRPVSASPTREEPGDE